MWKSGVQPQTKVCSKTHGKTSKTTTHVSPFAGQSSDGQSSVTSPKTGPELPSGVRYIRQPTTSTIRPIVSRRTPTETSRLRDRSASRDRSQSRTRDRSVTRDKSPEKNVRFGDLKKDLKLDQLDSKATTKTKTVAMDSRSRGLVRPVINPEPDHSRDNTKSKLDQMKTIATSPATRQTSPVFATMPFEGESKRSNASKTSPFAGPALRDESPIRSQFSTPSSTPDSRSSMDRQPIVRTQITTPGGSVRRSAAVFSKTQTNGMVHRNTLSFPIPKPSDRRPEQSRLSVNVNVAMSLGLDEDHKRYDDQQYDDRLSEGVPSEDELDWVPAVKSGDGFALNVAVRLRPFLQSEIVSKNDKPVIEMNGNTVRIINSDNENYNRTEFGFDVCLNSSDKDLFDFADQDQVFRLMGYPLLERALEGYNVCLFAYGQTGSGKSFTMSGTDSNPGIILRFIHQLYHKISSLPDVYFAVEVSYYEIYNEKIYDLLSDDKNHNKKILRIREHPQTGPYVENLSQHTAETYDEVMRFLRNGNRRRATASTAANQDSSRSHSIFTIMLSQLRNNCDDLGGDVSCSCGSRINLIDLAGSERHSGSNGDRLKEGSMINKSLLNLGKVISKLADYSAHPSKSAHIPYRDSALTWLLRESLGGNSNTSMIATISPAKCHLEETISTLRYAATARRIINYVHVNEDPKNKKIRELMDIIAELRAKQRFESEMIEKKVAKEVHFEPTTKGMPIEVTEPKVIEKISKSTNTSFVTERHTISKGTETSFIQPEKKTSSIATNTSFITTRPKTQNSGTSPVKGQSTKAKTISTSTSTLSIERMDSATETPYVERPSAYDLLRAQKLAEEQQLFLEGLRRHKIKLMSDRSECDEPLFKLTIEDQSDVTSGEERYYDCREGSQFSSLESSTDTNRTYTVGEDTVDKEEFWTKDEGWGAEEQNEMKWTGDEGQNEEVKTETQEWDTQEPTEEPTNLERWNTQEDICDDNQNNDQNTAEDDNWTEEATQKDPEKDNETNDWSQETAEVKDWSIEAKDDNEWSTDTKTVTDDQTKDNVASDDWGAGGDAAEDWGATGGDSITECGTTENKSEEQWDDGNKTENKTEDTGNNWSEEWSADGEPTDAKTTDVTPASDDWGASAGTQSQDFDWGADTSDTTVIAKEDNQKKDEDWGGDDW